MGRENFGSRDAGTKKTAGIFLLDKIMKYKHFSHKNILLKRMSRFEDISTKVLIFIEQRGIRIQIASAILKS